MMLALPFDSFLSRSGVVFNDAPLAKVLNALPELSPDGPWLAGGAVRRTIMGEPLTSDFDFFFRDEDQLKDFERYLTDAKNATELKRTEHQVTYLLSPNEGEKAIAVQLIHFKFYESAAEVIDSFDYTICQFAYDGVTLTMGDCSLWDLARKHLVVHRITYPVASMRRLLKYQRQGFYACTGCLTTLLQETVQNTALHAQLDIAYID